MKHDQMPYRSIGCSYYDQLEAFATQRTRCTISYEDTNGPQSAEGIIVDLFAKDGAEYLQLDNGTVIRLDHLHSVNGIPVNYAC
ncbi:MAG: hypothetical protein AB1600_03940 [Bacteroidota bacterium]